MKGDGLFAKEKRIAVIVIAVLVAVLGTVLVVSGKRIAVSGTAPDGAGGVQSAAERQRRRAEETFVYAKYGALWRYDGSKAAQIAKLPYADESEDTEPYLVDWAALTADEKTVYFIDVDESYDGKLYRQRVGQDEEPEKISSHISSYAVFGSDLFYLRESGALCKNGERIAQDIDSLQAIADDGGRVLVIDGSARLFLIDTDDAGNRNRIDREIVYADRIAEDLRTFFYITEDDELILWQNGERRTLGEIAWEFCGEEPDREELFYWAETEDPDDEPALCYYDATQGKSIRLFAGEAEPWAVGVFSDERLFWAVADDGDGEIDLLRRSMDGSDRWMAVEEDLTEVPEKVVCGADGRFYYLQGLLPEGVLHADGKELAATAVDIFRNGADVCLLHDVDAEAETFSLSVLEGAKSRLIADDVYIYRALSDGTLVTLRDFSERRKEGDLYLTKDGRDRLLDRDVMWFADAAY